MGDAYSRCDDGDGDPKPRLAATRGHPDRDGYARDVCFSQDIGFRVELAAGLLGRGRGHAAIAGLVGDRDVLVVTTPTVAAVYGEAAVSLVGESARSVERLVLPFSERNKTMAEVEQICRRAFDLRLGRTAVLVALGGGVCSDLVTVAAAIVRRGIAHVRLPTTLVGQVDAGIGIKGATNCWGAKSFLGVFHPPHGVLIDSDLLATLPTPFLRDGMAEIIKIAVIRDRELLQQLQADAETLLESGFQADCSNAVIESAVDGMLDELEPNLFENRGYKRVVDFGHTFSPTLESACDFTLRHGEAVAVDIALSSALAVELDLLARDDFELIADVITACGLPVHVPELTISLCRKALEHAEEHRGGSVNLVVPDGIGSGHFVESSDEIGEQALRAALKRVRLASTRLVSA